MSNKRSHSGKTATISRIVSVFGPRQSYKLRDLLDVGLWGIVGNGRRVAAELKASFLVYSHLNPRKTNLTTSSKMERKSPPKRRAAKACAFCRRRKASRLRCLKCHGLMQGSSVAITNVRYAPTARHTRNNAPTYQDPTGPGTSSNIHPLLLCITKCLKTNKSSAIPTRNRE